MCCCAKSSSRLLTLSPEAQVNSSLRCPPVDWHSAESVRTGTHMNDTGRSDGVRTVRAVSIEVMPHFGRRLTLARARWAGRRAAQTTRNGPDSVRRISISAPTAVPFHRRGRLRSISAYSSGSAQGKDWRATVAAVGGILSILLVAAGLFYTNDANRKQQKLGLDQYKFALQGQAADRFSKATDQLGQEGGGAGSRLFIRLGGIYSLRQLMIDSPDQESAAVEVLCAFVRVHSVSAGKSHAKTSRIHRRGMAVDHHLRGFPQETADVRAAISVLGRRPRPDLSILDFSGARLGLRGANFRDLNFAGADFSGADFTDADLRGADLKGADLTGALLSGAHLEGAQLASADLRGADLTGAHMQGTDLSGANLSMVKGSA
jgi:pentapeptide repeat protein